MRENSSVILALDKTLIELGIVTGDVLLLRPAPILVKIVPVNLQRSDGSMAVEMNVRLRPDTLLSKVLDTLCAGQQHFKLPLESLGFRVGQTEIVPAVDGKKTLKELNIFNDTIIHIGKRGDRDALCSLS